MADTIASQNIDLSSWDTFISCVIHGDLSSINLIGTWLLNCLHNTTGFPL